MKRFAYELPNSDVTKTPRSKPDSNRGQCQDAPSKRDREQF
jgi:hypothetical protein